ncbi:MAG: PAS domain-containing protein, partial [Persicimonas sp.]
LEATRRQLSETISRADTRHTDLRAANEELQSMNEEYKSTLEELETSREELQSVNEELQTVNTELSEKVDELSRTNDDLKNLMAATDVATLFVDTELRIKRFTEPLEELFNITEGDEGRPLSHITHHLQHDELEDDVRRVVGGAGAVEREVRDRDGLQYLLRITPYETTDRDLEGAVITLVDISLVERTRQRLRHVMERYRLLISNVREYAIFLLDLDGQITTWNPGAERLFGYGDDEIVGEPLERLYSDDEPRPGAFEAQSRAAAARDQVTQEGWYRRKEGRRFWGTGVMTALFDDDDQLRGFAIVLRDETRRRQNAQALRRKNEQLAERSAEVRRLASRLTRAEQRERERIAQVLHDDLQQLLYGIQMKLTFVERHAEGNDELSNYAAKAYEWIEEAIETTRALSVELSPPLLKKDGLMAALGWLRSQMEEKHGLEVDLVGDDEIDVADKDARVLLFQVIRELLFNVVKHAEVDRARVEVRGGDADLHIRIVDEGRGFDVEEARERDEAGFGIFSVRERLALFGGRLDIDSAPGHGTRISIYAPIEQQ